MRNWLLSPILLLFVLSACEKENESSGKETSVQLNALVLGSRSTLLEDYSCLQILAIDKTTNTISRQFSLEAGEIRNNKCAVTLPVGNYQLIFIANGPEEGEVNTKTGETPGDVSLKVVKSGEHYKEASDFLTATTSVQLTANSAPPSLNIDLQRKVGMIRVVLSDLSADIDSVKLEVSQVPTTFFPFNDSKTSGNATILKKMDYVKGSGTATGEVLTFPVAEGKAHIGILYTINQVTYRGTMTLSPAVEANQIVKVTGKYVASAQQEINFTINDSWGAEINGGSMTISEGDEVESDDRPITGSPTGSNLVNNGGFESWNGTPLLPANWLLNTGSSGGIHSVVTRNSVQEHLVAGSYSLRMEQSTYIYQDIPVTGNDCYQINLQLKNNTTAFKWRVVYSWRKTTSVSGQALSSVQTDQQGLTEGWTYPLGKNKKIRAPKDARYLRIEIRTYAIGSSTLENNEGVFVDNAELFRLE